MCQFDPTCDCHSLPIRELSLKELNDIKNDPFDWLKRQKNSRKRYEGTHYLVTFTRNPNSRYNLEKWVERIDKELHKSYVTSAVSNLENMETNIHCHTIIDATRILSIRDYKVFERDYGFVRVDRINVDHGVENYIIKDMPEGFTPIDRENFLIFFKDMLKGLNLI